MFSSNESQEVAAYVAAWALHRGQVDKAGEPYHLHPHAVARAVGAEAKSRGWHDDKRSLAVQTALLHDVLEDVEGITRQDFWHGIGVGYDVPDLVEALSFRFEHKEETRSEYYARIKEHRYSDVLRLVKKCDIDHNMRPDRLAKLDPADRNRLVEKYAKAYEELNLSRF